MCYCVSCADLCVHVFVVEPARAELGLVPLHAGPEEGCGPGLAARPGRAPAEGPGDAGGGPAAAPAAVRPAGRPQTPGAHMRPAQGQGTVT